MMLAVVAQDADSFEQQQVDCILVVNRLLPG